MGYNTRFTGTLKFTHELSVPQLKRLNEFFGEDPRDHPSWAAHRDIGYIDLKLAADYSGIEWDDGTEKTRGLEHAVNFILQEMRAEWPEFGLTGSLLAQGEDVEDRWQLVIGEDGQASKQKIAVTGTRVKCPNCSHKFILEAR